MPGLSGLETLNKLHAVAPQALVILLTAYGTVQDVVDAMKLGVYDFLIKTVGLEGMDPVVDRAVDLLGLRRRLETEKEHLGSRYGLSKLVAHSPAMQQILHQVQSITANAKSNVLLLGETGTGKEFLARVLHCNGARASGRSSVSTAPLFPRTFLKANFSAMNGVPSRGPTSANSG